MSNSSNGTIEISKAMIGCTGAVLAAIIGGVFLLISTGVIQIGFSSPKTDPQASTESNPLVEAPQEVSEDIELSSVDTLSPPQNEGPIREHQAVSIGTGVFENVTFSDGMAPYNEDWLWDNNHFNIQRIRREENPDGCGIAQYKVDEIWIGAAAVAKVTVNGSKIGTISAITPLQRHGFIANVSLNVGDQICVSPIPDSGFHIIFGPDIYYHHDSYCYRGSC